MIHLLVTIDYPQLTDTETLEAVTVALARLRPAIEELHHPGDTDAAGEAVWAAGEMLLRHAARPEERELTLRCVRGLIVKAETGAELEGGAAGE